MDDLGAPPCMENLVDIRNYWMDLNGAYEHTCKVEAITR